MGWQWGLTAVLCAAVAVGYAQSSSTTSAQKKKPATTSSKSASSKSSASKTTHHTATHHATSKRTSSRTKVRRKHLESAPTAVSRRLHAAFVASAQLRPMAQQLGTIRSAAAYCGGG